MSWWRTWKRLLRSRRVILAAQALVCAPAAPPPARGPQVLCKPKLMPLKSITLEKLQQMERRAAEAGGEGDPDAGGPPLALS